MMPTETLGFGGGQKIIKFVPGGGDASRELDAPGGGRGAHPEAPPPTASAHPTTESFGPMDLTKTGLSDNGLQGFVAKY